MTSLPADAGAGPLAVLSRFRLDFHDCLTARRDELSELADAVLCADGPVHTLAGLSLAAEHRRGHGALYDAVNHGQIAIGRLRRSLATLPLPRAADGRLMLAADVSNWLRPGAVTSPDRLFCHVYGRGKGQAQMIPGWPYSVIAALEPGRTCWTSGAEVLGPAEQPAGDFADLQSGRGEGGGGCAGAQWLQIPVDGAQAAAVAGCAPAPVTGVISLRPAHVMRPGTGHCSTEPRVYADAFNRRLPGQSGILTRMGTMSTTAAAQLAQLRTRFPEWAIIRTRCGIFIARHQITGQRVTAHTLTELENRLTGWGTRR